ncbi:MAG: hypothetical protein HQM14_16550 [SAR324 cluster bacterium]|nr:hypothetical protein [SAR324 cluster bacterium]
MTNMFLKSSQQINVQNILGKEVSEVNWEEGIEELTIRFDNFTVIPWIMPHWFGEKNKRVKEIEECALSYNFMAKALQIFTNNDKQPTASVRTTGEELIGLLEINRTKLTQSLKNNPGNANLRIQLVSKTLERLSHKPAVSVQEYRTLLLQAITANSLGEVSSDSLLLLKKIQDRYYLGSQRICQEKILRNQPKEQDSLKRKKEKEKNLALCKAHLNIIEADKKYLNTKLRKILETAKMRKFTLHVKDFEGWSPEMKDAENIKHTLIANTWEAIQFIRCFPLLHKEAQIFADWVIKIDPNNPLGMFFKGFISIAEADLLTMAYRKGFKSQKKLHKIQSILKTVIQYYEKALLLIKHNYSPANLNILAEYAHAILFLHNMGKLGRPTPTPVIASYITKIEPLLANAGKETQSSNMQKALQKIEHVSKELNFQYYSNKKSA